MGARPREERGQLELPDLDPDSSLRQVGLNELLDGIVAAQSLNEQAQREGVSCYRLYDADMPEYSFAIDLYGSAEDATINWAYVQEYAAPDSINRDMTAPLTVADRRSILP